MRDWCSAIGTKFDVSGAVRRTSILGFLFDVTCYSRVKEELEEM